MPPQNEPKPMPDLSDFRASLLEAGAVLTALRQLMPDDVTEDAINFLRAIKDDPAGLRLLRLAIHRNNQAAG